MDYFFVGIRAFIYVLIFSLVKITVPKLLGNIIYNKGEKGKTYFDKRAISNSLLGIAVFFTILFSFLSTLPSNIQGSSKTILSMCLVVFCLFWYVLSIMYGVWFLRLEDTAIISRSCFGKKNVLNIEDIDYYERKSNGKICLYNHSKKIMTFEPEYTDYILSWLEQKEFKLKNDKQNKYFTVRPAKYQRILSICCLVVFLIFLILGVMIKNVTVYIVFGCLFVYGTCNCVYHYSKKYVVGEGYIEISSFFKKTTIIPYSEVSKAEIKQGDNVSYLLLYSKSSSKPLEKINTYYENAFMLKDLAYQKKWIR